MSNLIGTIAGVLLGLTGIALFSDKLDTSVAFVTLPLGILFSWLTWKAIKKEEAR
jgi:hypothetical protein